MIKETIKYKDFNGNDQEETCYFHMTKTEGTLLELSVPGGWSKKMEKHIADNDISSLGVMWHDLILDSYGEKTEDGKRFIKSAEIRENFKRSAAFDAIFIELLTDEAKAKAFSEGLLR